MPVLKIDSESFMRGTLKLACFIFVGVTPQQNPSPGNLSTIGF